MQIRYKIGMIGLGSIGKRHLVNIDKVLSNKGIEYSIDLIRRKDSKDLDDSLLHIISNEYVDYESIPDDYDVLFISNPTHLHFETIKRFCHKTKNMFIEKPIFDKTTINLSSLSLNTKGIYYVACPLRYSEGIQYVKNMVDVDSIHGARVICSSYLPDWRPEIDYRESYSAHMDQGGGVSIDLIHEWDYMIYLFGRPRKVLSFQGKFSQLEIDSEDLSIYIAEYEKMLVEIHLDYFGRKPIRELQLFTTEETIVVDLIKSEIRFLNEGKVIQFSEDRNSYQLKEIANFFDILEGKVNNENDIYMALATLRIAKEGKL